MSNPTSWAMLLKKVYNGESIKCPVCGSNNVEHRFFSKDNIGCAQFKCNACGGECHLSRVEFPDNVKTESLY